MDFRKHLVFAVCRMLPACAVLGLLIFWSASCNVTSATNDAYYDSAINRAVILGFNNPARAQFIVDSIYDNSSGKSDFLKYKRYTFLAQKLFRQWKVDSSILYLDSMLYCMEELKLKDKYPQYYADNLNARGDMYYNENQSDSAFKLYYKARAIQMSIDNDSCTLSNYSYHLAMVAYRLEKYRQAADFFEETFSNSTHCRRDSLVYYRQQEVLSNIGLCFYHLKLYDSAIAYYKHALAFIDTEGGRYNTSYTYKRLSLTAYAVVMGNMAKVYVARGDNEAAKKLLIESIAINSVPGHDQRDAMGCNMQLAELYFNAKQIDKMLPVMADLKMALDTVTHMDVSLRWNHLMYVYYKQIHKAEQSEAYLEKYLAAKDVLDENVKGLKGKDYGKQLKDQQTQFEITLLKKTNQVNKLYLVLTMGFTFITVIIVIFVYYSYWRSKRNVAMLTSLNAKVNEQKIQLEDAMVQLQQNNEDKDRILHIVAHDLRNPINGVIMLGNYMLEEETDDEKRKSMELIVSANKNLQHLTQELLEFSGNARPSNASEKEQVDLNELGKHVVTLLQFKANEKKQKIVLSPASTAVELLVHKEKISRVISNLITNAIKFSKEGSEITLSIEKLEKIVRIKVKDSGIGIPVKMLPTIFDTFTNAKRHGTAGERSYGLGLSICKQIVEGHNGRIRVESEEGQGSTFFIELPF